MKEYVNRIVTRPEGWGEGGLDNNILIDHVKSRLAMTLADKIMEDELIEKSLSGLYDGRQYNPRIHMDEDVFISRVFLLTEEEWIEYQQLKGLRYPTMTQQIALDTLGLGVIKNFPADF